MEIRGRIPSRFECFQDHILPHLESLCSSDQNKKSHEKCITQDQLKCLKCVHAFFLKGKKEFQCGVAILSSNIEMRTMTLLIPYIMGAKRLLIITHGPSASGELSCDIAGNDKTRSLYIQYDLCCADPHDFMPLSLTRKSNFPKYFASHDIVISNTSKIKQHETCDFETLDASMFDLVIVQNVAKQPLTMVKKIMKHFTSSKCLLLAYDDGKKHIKAVQKITDALSLDIIHTSVPL